MTIFQLIGDRRPSLSEANSDLKITFDASVRVVHGVKNRWTSEPLPSGAVLTDHVITEQEMVTLDVIVTSARFGGFLRNRHITAWQRLKALAKFRPPLLWDVNTNFDFVENCVIDSVGAPRTPEDGNSATFPLVMRQLEFSQVDIAANLADAAQDLGLDPADLGSQGLG